MTYPIIRWNGGGGGAVGNDLAVRLGDGEGAPAFIPLMLNISADTLVADIGSKIRAAAESAGTAASPSDEDIARCRCVVDGAGDMPPDVYASAIEACAADPNGLLAGLEANGIDVSHCASGSAAPFYQNPWVIGGAAAVVLGGLAFFALK